MAIFLGDKIRLLRKEKKLTLEALAQSAGLSKSYLWELENRESQKPSAEKLSSLAKVLGVDVDFFLESDTLTPDEKHIDNAFFREYKNLNSQEKEQIRNIMAVIQTTGNNNG
jgi:transcriptional regulator with XRE-family HTH domain